MTDFERALVQAFNRHFEDNNIRSIAYRRKQHRFSSQVCDIMVDSKHPEYYLAMRTNRSVSNHVKSFTSASTSLPSPNIR